MRTAIALVGVLTGMSLAGCSSKPETPTSSREPASRSDRARLQGVWAVESIDDGFTGPSDQQKEGRVQFHEQQVIFTLTKDDAGERFFYVVDPSKTPKWMNLIQQSAKPEPGKKVDEPLTEECIYQLDGDTLILTRSPSFGQRPTELKPRPWIIAKAGQPGSTPVSLWRLKKTSEPFFTPKDGPSPPQASSKFLPMPKGTAR